MESWVARSERNIISIHEAGHAVAARACGLSIDRATIDPKVAGPGRGGCVWQTPNNHDCKPLKEFSDAPLFELARPCADDFTAEESRFAAKLIVRFYARTVTALAGTQAELLFYPDRTPMIATTDVQEAQRFSDLVTSTPEESAMLLDHSRTDAARILAARRRQVEAIAGALIERKTLDAADIDDVLSESSTPALRTERARRRRWAAMAVSVEQFKTMTGGGLVRAM